MEKFNKISSMKVVKPTSPTAGRVTQIDYNGPKVDKTRKVGAIRFKNKKRIKHDMVNELQVKNTKGTNIAKWSGGRALAQSIYTQKVKELDKEWIKVLKSYKHTKQIERNKLYGLLVHFLIVDKEVIQNSVNDKQSKKILNKAKRDFDELLQYGIIKV